MQHDPKVTCDFCENEIDTDAPWSALKVPVPAEIKKECAEEAAKYTPKGILGLVQIKTPSHYSLDCCNSCIAGLFPGLNAKVTEYIRAYWAKQRGTRATVPDDDDD